MNTLPASIINYIASDAPTGHFVLIVGDTGQWIATVYNIHGVVRRGYGQTPEDAIAALDLKLKDL
jgi:hypothetical protein